MHDPMTVAFEIRYPWLAYSKAERALRANSEFTQTYRAPLITIWHVDPETDGSDDSCDWFNRKGKLSAQEQAVAEAMWDVETILDNAPHYPNSRESKAWQPLSSAIYSLIRKRSRTHWWQVHPRWHVWHWSIQVHPYQQARRWLLTRCCRCGGRFRGEEGMYHMGCSRDTVA